MGKFFYFLSILGGFSAQVGQVCSSAYRSKAFVSIVEYAVQRDRRKEGERKGAKRKGEEEGGQEERRDGWEERKEEREEQGGMKEGREGGRRET